jgi:hypothetical protein
MDISRIKNYQALLEPGVEDTQLQFDRIFSGEGFIARGLSSMRLKVLKGIEPVLRRTLYPDESVDYLTWGVQSSTFFAFFLGWVMYFLNRTAIVLTSHRILLIRIDASNRPRELAWQLRYDAILSVKRTAFGNAAVKTLDGKQTVFEKVPRRDCAFLHDRIDELRSGESLEDSGVTNVEALCPHCHNPIYDRDAACPSCGGTFKSPKTATLRSLFFPGLGDLYLGHRGFAAIEMLGASLIWIGFWLPPTDELGRVISYPPIGEVLLGAVILLLTMHGGDALVTGRIGRLGVYPDRPGEPILLKPAHPHPGEPSASG